jgi:hypothetical protein
MNLNLVDEIFNILFYSTIFYKPNVDCFYWFCRFTGIRVKRFFLKYSKISVSSIYRTENNVACFVKYSAFTSVCMCMCGGGALKSHATASVRILRQLKPQFTL